jgi:hypothetical protein
MSISQILRSLQTLPEEHHQKVLEFIQSLQSPFLFQQWDNISDAQAQALQNEFAQEDIEFSENILTQYLSELEQEDKA